MEAAVLDQKDIQLLSVIPTKVDSISNLDVENYITVSCAVTKLAI